VEGSKTGVITRFLPFTNMSTGICEKVSKNARSFLVCSMIIHEGFVEFSSRINLFFGEEGGGGVKNCCNNKFFRISERGNTSKKWSKNGQIFLCVL